MCLCRDFLPRGSGIVTRRPLILQLVNNKAGENVLACLSPSEMHMHMLDLLHIHLDALALMSLVCVL